MKKVVLCIIVVGTLLLVGCGGGGEGGGGTTLPIETGAVIRQLQIGDHLVYSVSGTGTGDITGAVTGTLTMTVQSASGPPVEDTRWMDIVCTLDVTVRDRPIIISTIEHILQNADGDLVTAGWSDSTGDHPILSWDNWLPYMYCSPLGVGQSWSYNATFAPNINRYTSCSILSYEAVGGRMAYKSEQVNQSATYTSRTVEWFVPDWGYPVKAKSTVQYGSLYLDLTSTLRSKNF